MAFASLALGWMVAGRVLRPLRTITAAARDISSTNLHRRLALSGPGDEVKELGDTFDGLLCRLERSFQSQRQFVANASHELRTPLTLERALLEAALTEPDSSADSLRTTCERLLVANSQQDRLIGSLLTLATSEKGIERHELIDLAALAEGVLLSRHAEAERLDLRIEATLAPAMTRGDPDLVRLLVANLVDNALRYNLVDGQVQVGTGVSNDGATIRVSNTGPLVAAEEVAELFEPFRRLGGQRTRHGDGHGLGLSIVSAIAEAHAPRSTRELPSEAVSRSRSAFRLPKLGSMETH